MTIESIKKALRVALIAVATMSSGSLFQAGCGGGMDGYYGGGGIDPDVFQSYADEWDATIRE